MYSSTSSTQTRLEHVDYQIITPCRYTASVIWCSVYDYEAKSQKDELFDNITKTVKITGQALRPEISILVDAFPARE